MAKAYDIKRMQGWQRLFFLAMVVFLIAIFAVPGLSRFSCRQSFRDQAAGWVGGRSVSMQEFDEHQRVLERAVYSELGSDTVYLPLANQIPQGAQELRRRYVRRLVWNHLILLARARALGIDVTNDERSRFIRRVVWPKMVRRGYNSFANYKGWPNKIGTDDEFHAGFYKTYAEKVINLPVDRFTDLLGEIVVVWKYAMLLENDAAGVKKVYETWREKNRRLRVGYVRLPVRAFAGDAVRKADADRLVSSFQRTLYAQALLVDLRRPYSAADAKNTPSDERPVVRKEYDADATLREGYSNAVSRIKSSMNAADPNYSDEEKEKAARYVKPRRFSFEMLVAAEKDFENELKEEDIRAEYDRIAWHFPLREEELPRWKKEFKAGSLTAAPPDFNKSKKDNDKEKSDQDAENKDEPAKDNAEKPPMPTLENPPRYQPYEWVRARITRSLRPEHARRRVRQVLEKAHAEITRLQMEARAGVERDIKALEARRKSLITRRDNDNALFFTTPSGLSGSERTRWTSRRAWLDQYATMYLWRSGLENPLRALTATLGKLRSQAEGNKGFWKSTGNARLREAVEDFIRASVKGLDSHGPGALRNKAKLAENRITDRVKYFADKKLRSLDDMPDPETTATDEKSMRDAGAFLAAGRFDQIADWMTPFEKETRQFHDQLRKLAAAETPDAAGLLSTCQAARVALGSTFEEIGFRKCDFRKHYEDISADVALVDRRKEAKQKQRAALSRSSRAFPLDSGLKDEPVRVVSVDRLVTAEEVDALDLGVPLSRGLRPRGAPGEQTATVSSVLADLGDGQLAPSWHSVGGFGGVLLRLIEKKDAGLADWAQVAATSTEDAVSQGDDLEDRAWRWARDLRARYLEKRAALDPDNAAGAVAVWREIISKEQTRRPLLESGETGWVSATASYTREPNTPVEGELSRGLATLERPGDVSMPIEKFAGDKRAVLLAVLLEAPRYPAADSMRWKDYQRAAATYRNNLASRFRNRISRFDLQVGDLKIFSDEIERRARERRANDEP